MLLPELHAERTAACRSAGRRCDFAKPPAKRLDKTPDCLSAAGVPRSDSHAIGSGTGGDPEDYSGGLILI